jgi:hypothetical protein
MWLEVLMSVNPNLQRPRGLEGVGHRGLWKIAFALVTLNMVIVAATILKSGRFDMIDFELTLSSFVVLVLGAGELSKLRVKHLD